MRHLWLSLAVAVASPLAAQAPVATEPARIAKAQEMMRAMRIEDTMQKTMDAVLGQSMGRITEQALAALPNGSGIKDDPEFRAILKRHLDRSASSLTQQLSETMPALIGELTAIYARNFTVAELEDITRFYSSSTGQSYLTKTPELSRQTVEATQAVLLPKVMAAMPELRRQMEADIAAWIRSRKPAAKS